MQRVARWLVAAPIALHSTDLLSLHPYELPGGLRSVRIKIVLVPTVDTRAHGARTPSPLTAGPSSHAATNFDQR